MYVGDDQTKLSVELALFDKNFNSSCVCWLNSWPAA